MARDYAFERADLAVSSLNNATLAAPTNGTSGLAVSDAWLALSPPAMVVRVIGEASVAVDDMTLYGYDGARWWYMGLLKNGEAHTVTAVIGFSEIISLPARYTRFALQATFTGVEVEYSFTPMVTGR